MPSFSDVTELENLILEIIDAQSVTPKQVFQIRQYYMHAKEMHAQGNISLAMEIMRTLSGLSKEIQDLAEYHFKATGYAEALLFTGSSVATVLSVKTNPEPERKVGKPEPASTQQKEETDEGDEKRFSPESFGKKETASFDSV